MTGGDVCVSIMLHCCRRLVSSGTSSRGCLKGYQAVCHEVAASRAAQALANGDATPECTLQGWDPDDFRRGGPGNPSRPPHPDIQPPGPRGGADFDSMFG